MEALCRLSYPGGVRDDSNVLRRNQLVVLLLVASACSAWPDQLRDVAVFGNGSAELELRDVASTPEARAQGLMGVTDLAPDEGMAFVYDEPVTSTFWMKDTVIPLSIAFIDEAGRIVTISDMEPCRADPCATYGAASPFVLAVEANAGWFDDMDIRIGDRAVLTRVDGT